MILKKNKFTQVVTCFCFSIASYVFYGHPVAVVRHPERDGFMNTILEVSLVLFTDTEAIIVSLDVTKCPVISNIKLAEFVGGAPVALFIFDTNNLAILHFPITTLLSYHLRPFTIGAGM